uniref:Uncharacterized protein n=1 Tax=Branchiostoma floridae TaxID=7739 RepID=C3Z195_BRAFL|eukprot:XP_002597782.1 hypothetical protein BRAFLDRAFT_77314 [Branchiostoma floridae]
MVYDAVAVQEENSDHVPNFNYVRAQLERRCPCPSNPYEVEDVVIPEEWVGTGSGRQYLSRQDNDWGVLDFAMERNLKKLQFGPTGGHLTATGAKHVGISKREDLQSAIQRARLAREVRDLEADLRALQLDITSGKPINTPPAAPVSQLPGATPPVPPAQTTADQTPPPPVQITADQTPPPPAQEQVATTSDGTKLLISMGKRSQR